MYNMEHWIRLCSCKENCVMLSFSCLIASSTGYRLKTDSSIKKKFNVLYNSDLKTLFEPLTSSN